MAEYDEDFNGGMAVGFTSEKAAAVIVIGALAALILINRGFRGVSVGGLNVGLK